VIMIQAVYGTDCPKLSFHSNAGTQEINALTDYRETRQKYDLKNMVDEYVKVYEQLNGGKPLA